MSVVHGTIVDVTTVLFYLVVAAVIGLVVFFIAVFVFGRGEQMAPLDPRTSPAELPEEDITAEDVRKIRFALALRGYRMSDVDWTLERLGEQIEQLRRDNSVLRGESEPIEATPDLPAGNADEAEIPVGGDEQRSEPEGRLRTPVTVGAPALHANSDGAARSASGGSLHRGDDPDLLHRGDDPDLDASADRPIAGSSEWAPAADEQR